MHDPVVATKRKVDPTDDTGAADETPGDPGGPDDDSPRARFDRGEIRWRELIELEQESQG